MFLSPKGCCASFALLSITILELSCVGVADEHGKRVIDLAKVDFTTAETLTSVNVCVFGVRLGTPYGDSVGLANKVGRPVREWVSPLDQLKAVHVFYGDKELAAGKSMVTFESTNGQTVTKIGVTGMISGGLRGFEGLAVGETRTLLVRCNSDMERTRVLGKEDEEKTLDRDKFWAKTYCYRGKGICLMHWIDSHPTDPSSSCSLEFVHPARTR